jgi:hypothetical protein
MTGNVRRRFWVEAGVAALCGFLAVLTIFSQDWIEVLTGFDPDQHGGSVEWAIVAVLAFACAVLSLAARAEWRRSTLAAA